MNPTSLARNALLDAEIRKKTRHVLLEAALLDVPLDTRNDRADLDAAGLASVTSERVMVAPEDDFEIDIPDRVLNRHLFASIDSPSHAVAECLGLQD